MIQVTLRGLLARKLRLALTSLAIVLGMAMVSGTFILTDAVGAGVHHIIGGAYAKAGAVARSRSAPFLFSIIACVAVLVTVSLAMRTLGAGHSEGWLIVAIAAISPTINLTERWWAARAGAPA
jgi:hypothetical protein